MGLNYSLCALLHRANSESLLRTLGTFLDPASMARLENLTWSPASETRRVTLVGTTEIDARGIAGLQPVDLERENHYGLSLQVQLEPELKSRFGEDHPCFDSPGPFGYLWTSVYAGSRYLLIEMTAATSNMSRIVRDSRAIHDVWRQFGHAAAALVAYVDLEGEEIGRQLFPKVGEILLPDLGTLAYVNDDHYSVDLAAEYIRRVNGV